ncbi:MAG: outer membrane protein assembly factor BamA [Nitrospirota bacterium]
MKINHTISFILILMSIFSLIPCLSPLSNSYALRDSDIGNIIEGKVITSINVKSQSKIGSEELINIININVGDNYSSEKIRKSLDILYKKGIYKDIIVEADLIDNGILLRYTLIKKILISKIKVRGNRTVPIREILKISGVKDREEFTPDILKKVVLNVSTYYRTRGYFHVTIDSKVTDPDKDNMVVLMIEIKEGRRAKISRIEFGGNKVLSDFLLYLSIKSQRGDYYNPTKFANDIKSIEALYVRRGYLKAAIGPSDIDYDEITNEIGITIPIDAGIHVKILFKGNKGFTSKRLEEKSLVKEERSYDDGILEESVDNIRGFYRANGYIFAKCSYEKKEFPDEKNVEIVFTIDEGKRVYVRSVSFEGNRYFTEKRLRRLMETKRSRIFSSHTLNEGALKRDIKSIRDMYKKEGFLKSEIKEKIIFNEAEDRADILIKIDEGVQTLIDKVEFIGNRVFTDRELHDAISISKGKPYNNLLIRNESGKVQFLYSQIGYIYSRMEVKTEFKDNNKLVDIRFIIDEDRTAYIGRIILRGNDFTKDYVIKRELLIHPGQPYDYEKILLSQHRINRLRYFSEVRVKPVKTDEKEYIRDIVVSVKERNTGALEFGAGYGDEEGVKGFAQVLHRNIFGTGRSINLRAEGSQIENKYSINFKEPWLFSKPIDANLSFALLTRDRETYKVRQIAETLGIDKSFTNFTKGSLFYKYESNKLLDVKPDAVLLEEDEGRVNIASINPSIIRDTRDDPFNPASGSLNGLAFEDAAKLLGSDVQLVKLTVQSSWYIKLFKNAVFAFSMRGGTARNFGRSVEVPITERFFLGGRSTVRGYAQDSLGILNKTIINGVPTGGNAMLIYNGEMRFNLPKKIGIVFFIDAGNVWLSNKDVDLSDLKRSVGPGLRYNTPVGPLRLDFGYKLDREAGESASELHFTLGHAF